MAIDDELDVTPSTGFNQYQFSSDALNSLAIALITSLILANIGSVISKLMHKTPPNAFTYRSWLRSVIYVNTDDPLRILSWLFRRYSYRQRLWTLAPNSLRPGRLFVPLLGRLFYIGVSFVLIAMSMPRYQIVPGCSKFDYEFYVDATKATNYTLIGSICSRVPLRSDVGQVLSFAEACQSVLRLPPQEELPIPSYLEVFYAPEQENGVLHYSIASGKYAWAAVSVIQWQSSIDKSVVYLASFENANLTAYCDIMVKAVQHIYPECNVDKFNRAKWEGGRLSSSALMDCNMSEKSRDGEGVMRVVSTIGRYSKAAVQWRQTRQPQKRTKLVGEHKFVTNECPVSVAMSLPVVNIIPLLIALSIACAANIGISMATGHNGNAIDAGFHIVKEALGYDTANNPIEQSREYDEDNILPLQMWRCRSGRGHVGFIPRLGDLPVHQFHPETLVGRCEVAADELRAIRSTEEKMHDDCT